MGRFRRKRHEKRPHRILSAVYVDLLVAGIVAVVLGIAGGVLVMWLFTDGVVRRLRRLERATLGAADVRRYLLESGRASCRDRV